MNILLSSVGRRSYLVDYFKAALRGQGKVVATNSIAEATGMFVADVAETVPPAKAPGFVDALLDICRRHDVKLLCSLHDWEALHIAPYKARFLAEGVTPAVPDPEIVNICLDKYKTAQFAESLGVSSPKCFIVLKEALDALESNEIEFPLILKPRWGQGSIGIKKVRTIKELKAAYLLINAELLEAGLEYLAGEQKDYQVLIQQFVKGREYGADVVNDLKGHFAACFVKYKFSMRFGETDAAETISMSEIEEHCRTIAGATKHPGILDADFIMSDAGRIYLLELNPRFGGGYPFSHIAGANIPAALIAWAEGKEPAPSFLRVKLGVRGYKDIKIVCPNCL